MEDRYDGSDPSQLRSTNKLNVYPTVDLATDQGFDFGTETHYIMFSLPIYMIPLDH